MDAHTFKCKYGKSECERVADKAGTNYAYFHQIAVGLRRPSVELAEKLVNASDKRLDLLSLLTSKKKVA